MKYFSKAELVCWGSLIFILAVKSIAEILNSLEIYV